RLVVRQAHHERCRCDLERLDYGATTRTMISTRPASAKPRYNCDRLNINIGSLQWMSSQRECHGPAGVSSASASRACTWRHQPAGGTTPQKRYWRVRSEVGVNAGGRRCFVACSYAYASLISSGSLQARPKNEIPTGKPRKKPAGTVMCG